MLRLIVRLFNNYKLKRLKRITERNTERELAFMYPELYDHWVKNKTEDFKELVFEHESLKILSR